MPMSYEFHEVPISSIRMWRKRQRKEFRGIDELADSIRRNGLLHPITIDRKNFLVAGERRLRAHKQLGLETIHVHYLDELNRAESRAIELEENIKRVDLTWEESCLATAELNELRQKDDPEWTQEKTAEAIGLSPSHVSQLIQVANALRDGDEFVAKAENFSAAVRSVRRKQKRAISTTLSKIDLVEQTRVAPEKETGNVVELPTPKPPAEPTVICGDFITWAESYSGPKFNFIHCDFPYGVRMGKTTYGGSATWKKYCDDPEVFQVLLNCLLTNYDRIFLSSAHIMFWFSMNTYMEVLMTFREAGFRTNAFPLIWAKDKGLIPDPRREGRRVYETAIFASLGDRKILTSVPNLIYNQVEKKSHISEKPQAVLRHFFRMFVDEHSEVLDPTCGSGNALAVAKAMGAQRVFGMDIEQEHVESANRLIERTEVEAKADALQS